MTTDIYRQRILDHYKNPRHHGTLKIYTHTAEYKKGGCDDQLSFQVLVNDDNIADIAFIGDGRALTIAAASMLTEHLLGKPVSVIQTLTKKDIEKLLGIEISEAHEASATLGLETLKKLKKV